MAGLVEDRQAQASPEVQQEERLRKQAIEQIERRRRFWVSTATFGVVMVILVLIWATSEYSNAQGWPTDGFGQSSGVYHVWNYWIVYPFGAWVLGTAAHAWYVWGRKPISERDVEREIRRQSDRT